MFSIFLCSIFLIFWSPFFFLQYFNTSLKLQVSTAVSCGQIEYAESLSYVIMNPTV